MSKRQQEKQDSEAPQPPKCGLVMPISKSSRHSAEHWADVQILLHRAIADAGFAAENVWEGDLTDRISKRIVGNIFAYDVVVVDASDLNPNVMLELGLRLASKKPTIVVTDDVGSLPFDIRDLQAIPYPSDLNILGMEKFFSDLTRTLAAKSEAYRQGSYEPFLSDVVVEVVQPETREVSLDSAVLERLDEINRRVSRIEMRSRHSENVRPDRTPLRGRRRFTFTVPEFAAPSVLKYAEDHGYVYSAVEEGPSSYILVSNVGPAESEGVALRAYVQALGGSPGVPDEMLRRLLEP